MKTFVVLFLIAVSFPSEAQRVKENVRQRVEIVDNNPVPDEAEAVVEEKEEGRGKKKPILEKPIDALRKK